MIILNFHFSECTNSPDWTSQNCTDTSSDVTGFTHTCLSRWYNGEEDNSYSSYSDCSDTEGNSYSKFIPFTSISPFEDIHSQINIKFILGSSSNCHFSIDPWTTECIDLNSHTNSNNAISWSEECHSHNDDITFNQSCKLDDGSSRTFEWYWDMENDKFYYTSCFTSLDGTSYCDNCASSYDDAGNWIYECEETGEREEEEEDHIKDPYQELIENVEIAWMVIDACGCGDHEAITLPQDSNGFIYISGSNVHCETICWVGESIIDLMELNGFLPTTEFNPETYN